LYIKYAFMKDIEHWVTNVSGVSNWPLLVWHSWPLHGHTLSSYIQQYQHGGCANLRCWNTIDTIPFTTVKTLIQLDLFFKEVGK